MHVKRANVLVYWRASVRLVFGCKTELLVPQMGSRRSQQRRPDSNLKHSLRFLPFVVLLSSLCLIKGYLTDLFICWSYFNDGEERKAKRTGQEVGADHTSPYIKPS